MTTAENSDPYEEKSSLPDELEAIRITSIEERRGKVLFMKLAGATFITIADECKVSVATVRKDYDIALRAQAGHWTPEKRIARQSAVMSDALRANYPAMMNGDPGERKDATVAILRMLEREAKLFGLDAPQRIIADVNPADFASEASRLISRIVQLDPSEIKELTRAGYQPPRSEPLDVEEVTDRWDLPEGAVDPDPAWSPEPMASPFSEHLAARRSAAPRAKPESARRPDAGLREDADAQDVAGQHDGGRTAQSTGQRRGLSSEADESDADDLDGWSNID